MCLANIFFRTMAGVRKYISVKTKQKTFRHSYFNSDLDWLFADIRRRLESNSISISHRQFIFLFSSTARTNSKCQLMKLGFYLCAEIYWISFITESRGSCKPFSFHRLDSRTHKKTFRFFTLFLQFSNIYVFCADNFRFQFSSSACSAVCKNVIKDSRQQTNKQIRRRRFFPPIHASSQSHKIITFYTFTRRSFYASFFESLNLSVTVFIHFLMSNQANSACFFAFQMFAMTLAQADAVRHVLITETIRI